jgi:arsenate reductase
MSGLPFRKAPMAEDGGSASPFRVLFLCTGNSARSILGEYLLRHRGGQRFSTCSAGAQPTGRVHPLALRVLAEDYGLNAADARSESLTIYRGADLDLVVTVCDHARDACPVLPAPSSVHWGFPDPAEALDAFRQTARRIDQRVGELAALDVQGLPVSELHARLAEIGGEDG